MWFRTSARRDGSSLIVDVNLSEIWTKLLRSLGIQRVLTSPYHPKGNATNEQSTQDAQQHAPRSPARGLLLKGMG